jgi:hypothetical protein
MYPSMLGPTDEEPATVIVPDNESEVPVGTAVGVEVGPVVELVHPSTIDVVPMIAIVNRAISNFLLIICLFSLKLSGSVRVVKHNLFTNNSTI